MIETKKISSLYVPTTEKTQSITFECTEDCVDEDLLAEVYELGLTNDTPIATVSGGSDVGVSKGEEITMELDFDDEDIVTGSYSCVVRTAETGVIVKFIVRVQ